MSQQLTKQAALKCVNNRIALLSPAVPVAWPNKKFSPPAGAWLAVHYLPSNTSSETLGEGGEDELPAIIQLDVSIPTNTGDKIQNDILTAFEAYFIPGTSFTFSGQTIKFLACNRSNGRIVDNAWRVSLSISFYGRYNRPSLA